MDPAAETDYGMAILAEGTATYSEPIVEYIYLIPRLVYRVLANTVNLVLLPSKDWDHTRTGLGCVMAPTGFRISFPK